MKLKAKMMGTVLAFAVSMMRTLLVRAGAGSRKIHFAVNRA